MQRRAKTITPLSGRKPRERPLVAALPLESVSAPRGCAVNVSRLVHCDHNLAQGLAAGQVGDGVAGAR